MTIWKIRPITSLLKVCLFSICIAFTANVFAEYYVVYPEIVYDMGGPCCHHRYHKYHKVHHHKRYKKYSYARIETYYVWHTCGGALWVPRCGGCSESYTPCRTHRCDDFYIPPQYIEPNSDYNYYDDPPMDMRTADDF